MQKIILLCLAFIPVLLGINSLTASPSADGGPGYISMTGDYFFVISHEINFLVRPNAWKDSSSEPDTTLQKKELSIYAVFPSHADSDSLLMNVGPVSLNQDTFYKDTSNLYFGVHDSTYPAQYIWSVGTSGNTPFFNDTISMQFPDSARFVCDSIMNKSSGYTLNLADTVRHADSLVFVIDDHLGNSIKKTTSWETMSLAFSTTDLGNIPNITSQGVPISLSVVSYKTVRKTKTGGKVACYVLQSVTTNQLMLLKP